MDFSLSEEQREARHLARKILEDLSTHERLKEVEVGNEGYDLSLWKELAKAHLLGVGLPEAYGGSDMGFLTTCLLIEEMGRTVAALPGVPTLVLGALPILEFGSAEQKQQWLPGVARGELILTGALHEAGSDAPAKPTTAARPKGDAWLLDGQKMLVPGAHLSARVLVPARSPDGAVGLFLVDPRAPGATLERQHSTNRAPYFQLALSGAAVGAPDVLVGPRPSGTAAVQWVAERATAAYCFLQLGVSEKALEMTAEYARGRIQFGRPIGSFQAVHARAADAHIQVQAIRLTTWLAGWKLGEGRDAAQEVAVAKFWAAEGGQFVAYAAQHLHGGIGIDVDYPLHRYYLWAKQIELTLGSAALQLARIGAQMARQAAPPAG